MEDDKLFSLLQLNDALFPIGAFAHSYGLETYVLTGEVHDNATAQAWLQAYFRHSFAYGELLAARLAYLAMQKGDIAELCRLDEILFASSSPTEKRTAFVKLGRRLAKTAMRIGLPVGADFMTYVQKQEAQKRLTHPVAYGALTASLHLPLEKALAHYTYAQMSALVNVAVKLVPLSQTSGQKILSTMQELWQEILQKAQAADETMLAPAAPGLDVHQMQHEVLYSRLYMS